jgi:hypothetical protein
MIISQAAIHLRFGPHLDSRRNIQWGCQVFFDVLTVWGPITVRIELDGRESSEDIVFGKHMALSCERIQPPTGAVQEVYVI